MTRRREHTVRDHPTDPDAVLIDVRDGRWSAIDRVDLERTKGFGMWGINNSSAYPHVRGYPSAVRCRNRNLAGFILRGYEDQPSGYEPDHRNGDVFDNRRANLRWLPRAVNRRRMRTGEAA